MQLSLKWSNNYAHDTHKHTSIVSFVLCESSSSDHEYEGDTHAPADAFDYLRSATGQ